MQYMLHNRKTLDLDGLLAMRAEARAAGKAVVHCHGCFDIVHPGHIAHLQFARSLGDILVVTVSGDAHVNKGFDRPLIPDGLRASSLAALECVDWVYVNPDPTASALLEALRPDVYVKGHEYETNSDPRFLAEREAVERNGGRVVFSSGDVVFSSTALIGTMQRGQFDEEKLTRLRDRYGLDFSSLQQLVKKFADKKVVVVGDYILDRYHFCDATGVAGEAPILSLRTMESRDYDGGAGVIALHLAAMGARPVLVSALADDELSRQIELRMESAGVDVRCHHARPAVVAKHRYLVDQNKLFKVDEGNSSPADSQLEGLLASRIIDAADGADAVIFADFGYGMLSAGLLSRVLPTLRKTVPILTGDVSGRHSHLMHFREMDLLCPTEREIRESLHEFSDGLGAVVWKLLESTGTRQAIVTLGKQGLVTFEPGPTPTDRLRSEYVPALAGHAIDPLGCGDALLATATLALAAGGFLAAAAFLGALAASVEVGEIGNQPITTGRLLTALAQREPMPVRMAG
jgi:rfaE bifunctional protein kinase chain/domain/rfaE bifunctional protein nucleotidyltransferase chain/domain